MTDSNKGIDQLPPQNLITSFKLSFALTENSLIFNIGDQHTKAIN